MIEQELIPINGYSRPGIKRHGTKAVVIHWVANPKTSAKANAKYFASLAQQVLGTSRPIYGSAHYIIGLDGEIIQTVPDDEVAFHVGSTKKDPVSGMVYTDLAREFFGVKYCGNFSPNYLTVGIELCHEDWTGKFNTHTYDSAVGLAALLLVQYELDINHLLRHFDIVGWKECPLWFVKESGEWETFKACVKTHLQEKHGRK